MRAAIEKLKYKWNIKSNVDFVLIMLVFSLAGMGVALGRKGIFHVLGLQNASLSIKILISLLVIVPLYQLSTLLFSLPLGQFNFFWERQKAIGRHLQRSWNKFFR